MFAAEAGIPQPRCNRTQKLTLMLLAQVNSGTDEFAG
jgi:hypothetical protein